MIVNLIEFALSLKMDEDEILSAVFYGPGSWFFNDVAWFCLPSVPLVDPLDAFYCCLVEVVVYPTRSRASEDDSLVVMGAVALDILPGWHLLVCFLLGVKSEFDQKFEKKKNRRLYQVVLKLFVNLKY